MPRPLETTFWMRFKHFLKGVFFYNTIYWRRASDDIEIRRMSREERASLRPKRDFDLIRPRGNPRPAVPPAQTLPPAAIISAPPAVKVPAPPVPPVRRPVVGPDDEVVEIQRRKKRHRSHRSSVKPRRHHDPSEGNSGMFSWLFKK